MRPRRKLRLIVALVAILAAGAWWARPYVASAAVLLDLAQPQSALRAWLPVRQLVVTTEDLRVPTRHGDVVARVYRPEGPPTPGVAVFPGIHAGGVDEPRLDALSRRVAAAGATVLSVPLPDLRAYRITPESTDVIEDVASWMSAQPLLATGGKIGLVGVSFSGGLAVVAAGRPALQGRLTGVLSIGGHADLPRVMRALGTGVSEVSPESPGTAFRPHDYGLALITRAALPYLVPSDQVAVLDTCVVAFLDASSRESTDYEGAVRDFAKVRSAAEALPEPARQVMGWVNDRDVAALGRAILPYVDRLGNAPALSPLRSPIPHVPVFLLHGEDDAVIPTSETTSLAAHLRSSGAPRVEWLITPLLTHADVRGTASAGDVWRLVRFWAHARQNLGVGAGR